MNGPRNRNLQTWLVTLSTWATFLFFGAIAAPLPGVNEPHYLCKAKHFWQPEWCSQDFFLASPNAHTVFFATIGSLTNFVTFEQAAWIGRALATLVLAWGWIRCLSPMFFTPWATLWCAWIFLACAACGNFSGEWLVGGVEGKVFAYGFLFAAFGDVLRRRWRWAAVWTGAAISFHPVVGVWGLLAFKASMSLHWLKEIRRARRTASIAESHPAGTALRTSRATEPLFDWATLVQSGVILVLLSLPGLIPVIRLLTEHVSAETRYAANYIQVYFRLAHHLDPMLFPARAYWGYAALLVFWLFSLVWGGRNNSKRAFDQIVAWSIVFAVVGIAIGYGPRPPKLMPWFALRMNLLKFYPFRLADVLLPIAVAVSLVGVLERTVLNASPSMTRRSPIPIHVIMMLLVFVSSLLRAYSVSESNRYSHEDRRDWLDVCHWINTHLPPDAVVQSPTNGWAFKWFAQRAEYVAFKDCPQDAAGIVEWNRRLNFLQKWYEQKYADQLYSASELKGLRQETGLTHLLTDRLGPLELEPVYHNGTFQVYDLRMLGD